METDWRARRRGVPGARSGRLSTLDVDRAFRSCSSCSSRFPIMVRNALAWMHEQESSELLRGDLQPWRRHPTALFTMADDIRRRPVGSASGPTPARRVDAKCAVQGRQVLLPPILQDMGHYCRDSRRRARLPHGGQPVRARSSQTLALPDPPDEPRVKTSASSAAGFLFGRDLWPLLLLDCAAVLWVLEWGLFHRRITE